MKKKILIGALDWGLGHATRCIPVINLLIDKGCEPIIASSGSALKLLKSEFPGLKSIELPAYNIKYPADGSLMLKLAVQLPAIRRTIHRENVFLKELIQKENIGAVISDNRYGLYNNLIPSIFITHQLFIKAPPFLSFGEFLVERINFSLINNFSECWIPDFKGETNLSGDLSHKKNVKNKFFFIGLLSRFQKMDPPQPTNTPKKILVILSGPEPQRSLLENKVIRELSKQKQYKVTVIRGIVGEEKVIDVIGSITRISHLNSAILTDYLQDADLIICRSGYSSIMDLAATAKPAILIPTPGQTEQEYLAKYHFEAGNFYTQTQKEVQFMKSIPESFLRQGLSSQPNTSVLQERIEILIGKL